MNKKLPTINIKGSEYTLVKDRVIFFNQTYPNGSINCELVSPFDSELVVVKAIVVPDCDKPNRTFTDYSQAKWGDGYINKTSALENASTSAVGRALAMMGIGVIESIASVDEINKAEGQSTVKPASTKSATPKQIEWMRTEARRVSGLEHTEDVDKWITEMLTISPQKVPLRKVHGAVERIKGAKEAIDPNAPLPDVDVTDEDMQKLENGELPY